MQPLRDTQPPARIFGLDGLRAAAIVLVLISHTWPTTLHPEQSTIAGVFGVELFFVLSGFLIGGILLKLADAGRLRTWKDLCGFWRRRWYRTLPNYYLFLGLQMAWRSWVQGYPAVFETFSRYFFFLQNFLRSPGYAFQESWSLAVEEWFYLLFALALWLGLRLAHYAWKAWLAVIALFLLGPWILKIWIAATLVTQVPDMDIRLGREFWEYNFHKPVLVRLDVLMYGVGGALLAARRPRLWRQLANFWWAGLILLAIAAGSLTVGWPLEYGRIYQGLLLWPCMAIGFALITARCSLIREQKGWMATIARQTALLSYALYLCHNFVIMVFKHVFGPKSFWHLPAHTWLWCALVWIVSFAVAGVIYRWFEKPFMDLRDRPPQIVGASQ